MVGVGGGEVRSAIIGVKREKYPSPLWYGVYFSGLKLVALGEISESESTRPYFQENKQKYCEAENLDIVMTEYRLKLG